jgi:chemotaxis protein CheX
MIDANFINPFLSATLNVLKIQANIIAEPGKLLRKNPGESLRGDVSGVVGITSNTFNGSVAISFPEATFLKVISGMLGEEVHELTPDIIDGAGEITNMIFGQAKIVLNDRGHGIQMALPQVVTGKDHSLMALSKGPAVVVPFTGPAGEFTVEISLSE